MNTDNVEIEVTMIRETDAAILVRGNGVEAWLPKSLCFGFDSTNQGIDAEPQTFEVPEFLAIEKGLV